MEAYNRRTEIRGGNRIRGRGGSEAFSRNSVHRGRHLATVWAVCTFIHSVPRVKSKPNPLEAEAHRNLGVTGTTRNPRQVLFDYGIARRQIDHEYGWDLIMP